METLDGPIRPYAWGSRTALAALRGRGVPSPTPEAELWLGAHPSAPSILPRPDGEVSLGDLVTADPAGVLGARVADRFGARLPYLMKVLAAAEPLSLQAHPDEETARERYDAERAAGAAEFNYSDRHHKPELLVAASDFEALCGFRDPVASAGLLAGLAVPELEPVVASLRAGALDEAVSTLLRWPEAGRPTLVGAVVASAAAASGPFPAEYAMAGKLAKHYPGDVGVVVALLLNLVTLEPGEAIWMPAGNLHAYLRGTGVEIMAASDNVLRGGMTPKRVDVDELLRVLRFTPLADPVVRAQPVAPGVVTWPVPVAEFRLHRVTVGGGTVGGGTVGGAVPSVELALDGPRTALCLAGEVTVDDGQAVTLRPGRAAFGPATDRPLTLTGDGVVYVATTNVDATY